MFKTRLRKEWLEEGGIPDAGPVMRATPGKSGRHFTACVLELGLEIARSKLIMKTKWDDHINETRDNVKYYFYFLK